MIRCAKLSALLLTGFLMLSFVLNVHSVSAADDIQRVYDNAGLLTDDEINKLEQQAQTYSTKRNINYLIVTTDNTEEYTSTDDYYTAEAFTTAFYETFVEKYGDKEKNCAILTIDMSTRYSYIVGKAGVEAGLSHTRCDQAYNQIKSKLSEGDYYGAFSKYIKTVHRYLGVNVGVDPELVLLKLWFQVLCGLLIGGIVVGIMVANTGGRMTVNQETYLDQKDSRILARRDIYLRTTTTRVRKPQTNSGGGGGGSRGGGGSGGGGHF